MVLNKYLRNSKLIVTDLNVRFTDCQTRMYQAVVEMLRWFAGHQIRNVAVCTILRHRPLNFYQQIL